MSEKEILIDFLLAMVDKNIVLVNAITGEHPGGVRLIREYLEEKDIG